MYYLMGNIPSSHVRIWNELGLIGDDAVKIKMLDTLLNGPEYVVSMKQTGIYSDLVTWVSTIRRGQWSPFPKYIPPVAPSSVLAKAPPAKRAMDYLHEAYEILGLSDDEPLTPELLKAAYKRRAVSCHPDKGGDPEVFDALTKAYLYLQEVYKKLVPKNVRPDSEAAPVTMESAVKYRNDPSLPSFDNGSNSIAMVIRDENIGKAVSTNVNVNVSKKPMAYAQIPPTNPIRVDPKKLDMNVFNQLFEQNRLPDPEKDDGYGDWLKSQEASLAAKKRPEMSMRGKFNLNVFNETFENEARELEKSTAVTKYDSPDALILTPGAVVLGGEKPAEYTAPAGSRVQYTDLKAAYSTRTTFSHEVGDVKVGNRSYEQAKAEREKDPGPTTPEEAARLAELANRAQKAEQSRQMRAAAYDTNASAYHDKMKQRLFIME